MGERGRTAALVVCFVLLGALLAGLSAGLSPAESQRGAVTKTVTRGEATGTVVVEVFLGLGADEGFLNSPVAGANVSLSSALAAASLPVLFHTNSTGELTIDDVALGQYTVAISDPDFQRTTNVTVEENTTTQVEALVTRDSYPVLFSDLSDPQSSGAVAPWSDIYVAVSSSPSIPLNQSIFLESSPEVSTGLTVTFTEAATATGPIAITGFGASVDTATETPLKLVSYSSDSGSGTTWLTVEPVSFLQLSSLGSLSLATYTSFTEVTSYAS